MGSDHATPLPVVLQTKGQLAVPAQHGQNFKTRENSKNVQKGDVWI